MAVFGGPRESFTESDILELKKWLNSGGRVLILLSDSGERIISSNINTFLQE